MKPHEFLCAVLIMILMAAMGGFLAISWFANANGLTFWQVFDECRMIASGPLVLAFVLIVQKSGVPLPFTISNTWPVVLALFWIGCFPLLKILAAVNDDNGLGYTKWEIDGVLTPWYLDTPIMLIGAALIVIIGYSINYVNREHGH
jgi:hypothetical protein